MKTTLLIVLLTITTLVSAQTNNPDVNKFITLFKSQLSTMTVGKIEEHYDQGYFTTLSESEYFDKDFEVGITAIYQKCAGQPEAVAKQEILNFFEQHKKLKLQRKEMTSKMTDFNFMRSYLRIRIYPDMMRPQYENHAIVKNSYKGLIEVIVFDLPSGIGSVQKKYLDVWKQSESDIYLLAKNNTLNNLNQKFEKAEVAKTGEEFYLLSSDTDLYIISAILDLKKSNPPAGKFGTLISIPNNTVITALPLNDKEKINQFCLSFMGLTNFMYESKDTKPVCDNLFWLYGNEIFSIEKDLNNKKLIYPAPLQKLIEN